MDSIRIHFSMFWPGFLEGTDPNTYLFFLELFKRVFNKTIIVEYNYNNADILCENASTISTSLIYSKQWKYSFLVTGESVVSFGAFSDHYNSFMCFLSGANPLTGLKWVKFPLFSSYLFCNTNKFLSPVDKVPQKMVCAIIANTKGSVRNKFLDKLETRTHIEYGGSFRNNIGYYISGNHNSNELIEFMRQYKFVVTMENNEEEYYITEKICNGLFAGIVPIYWGSPNVSQYFNSDRFLYLKNNSDNEIDRVINEMLNMDDNSYLKMVNSPILINTDVIDQIVTGIKLVLNIN